MFANFIFGYDKYVDFSSGAFKVGKLYTFFGEIQPKWQNNRKITYILNGKTSEAFRQSPSGIVVHFDLLSIGLMIGSLKWVFNYMHYCIHHFNKADMVQKQQCVNNFALNFYGAERIQL